MPPKRTPPKGKTPKDKTPKSKGKPRVIKPPVIRSRDSSVDSVGDGADDTVTSAATNPAVVIPPIAGDSFVWSDKTDAGLL